MLKLMAAAPPIFNIELGAGLIRLLDPPERFPKAMHSGSQTVSARLPVLYHFHQARFDLIGRLHRL
jgi:hypothetical protein